jgi:hypothetical protein
MFSCFSRDISTGADVKLTGNDGTTLSAFNLRSDERFGIHTVICHFDSRPKTSDVSRLRLVRNIITEDKKLDIEYLLHS